LRNGGFQTWHGHLAREKDAIPREMSQGITGKMPVPRYFASAFLHIKTSKIAVDNAIARMMKSN
jgi:hypothetical protein